MRYLSGFLFLGLLLSAKAVSQSTPHLPSHGTVNIILANPQGMIIMTDSMLSSDGKPEFYGEKLFRFDESTYLTLAGQYVEPGPDFGQTQHIQPFK
jgi:hypothetical protein